MLFSRVRFIEEFLKKFTHRLEIFFAFRPMRPFNYPLDCLFE